MEMHEYGVDEGAESGGHAHRSRCPITPAPGAITIGVERCEAYVEGSRVRVDEGPRGAPYGVESLAYTGHSSGGSGGGGSRGEPGVPGPGGVDEVWIGPGAPPGGTYELWVDEDEELVAAALDAGGDARALHGQDLDPAGRGDAHQVTEMYETVLAGWDACGCPMIVDPKTAVVRHLNADERVREGSVEWTV